MKYIKRKKVIKAAIPVYVVRTEVENKHNEVGTILIHTETKNSGQFTGAEKKNSPRVTFL